MVALTTSDNQWMRTDVEDQAYGLARLLQTQYQLNAGDTIALVTKNTRYLLLSMIASAQAGLTCLLVDPLRDEPAVGRIVGLHKPAVILTEQPYAAAFLPAATLCFLDALPLSSPDAARGEAKAAEGTAPPLVFCTAGPQHQLTDMVISAGLLARTLQRLDVLLHPGQNDVFLLLHALPLEQAVIDIWWAYTRQIQLVVQDDGPATDLHRFIPARSVFPMHFGLFFFGSSAGGPQEGSIYRLLLEAAEYADTHHFSAIWTPERHFNEFGGIFPNPSVLGAAIAGRTSRLQIRCGSIVSPLHHSIRIAEDWSVVDHLSNGRVALSFASGWHCDDFVLWPERYKERHTVMMQQVEEVKKLWRGEAMLTRNGLQQEVSVKIYPRPVQQELPVWITAAGKAESFIDAGSIGANVLTHLLWQSPDELAGKVALYRQALADNGFDPGSRKVAVMIHTYLGEDRESVKAKVEQPLKNYIRSSLHLIETIIKSSNASFDLRAEVGRYGSIDDKIPGRLMDELLDIAFLRFFDHSGLLGTVEDGQATIRRLRGYGVDEVACLIDFGLPEEDILQGLHCLNKLRDVYDCHPRGRHRVTLTHCTQELYRQVRAAAGDHFFGALRSVLVTAEENAGPDFTGGVRPENLTLVGFHPRDEDTMVKSHGAPDQHGILADIHSQFQNQVSDDF